MSTARRAYLLLSVTFALLILTRANISRGQTQTESWKERGPDASGPRTYTNPLEMRTSDGGRVENCADPAIIRGQQPGDDHWYMYCTSDPLGGADRGPNGNFNFRLIPIHKSLDLVNWIYVGDVFAARPAWVAGNAGLWAPDIQFFNGQYYLYYSATNTNLPGGGSAIGVATGASPAGPWTDAGAPAVEPHPAPCCPNSRRATIDSFVLTADDGQRYIYYGSFFGGISARKLSADGLTSDPSSRTQIAIDERYEAPYIVRRHGYYYLFVSAASCCNGPLSGYNVYVGRSRDPLGPYVDREGIPLLAGRNGGTIVIAASGNRWVGPGHNAALTDFDGQDWFLYHAIDRDDPYFAGAAGFTKRPALLDPLDWVDGWPTVRGGKWASTRAVAAPAAQPSETNGYEASAPKSIGPGNLIQWLSDEFDDGALGSRWAWVRQPAAGAYRLGDGAFGFDTQAADLFVNSNNASVLTERAPPRDYIVETRVRLNAPPEGCCFNFVQAGLVIYAGDDNYIKLTHASIWGTRQTEFAKEVAPVPPNYPRYGSTFVGPSDEWTYLRIAKRTRGGEERYTAYTSRDGAEWVRGGTWTHNLGAAARIGLVAMGGTGYAAQFDYVRVYRLSVRGGRDDANDAPSDTPEN